METTARPLNTPIWLDLAIRHPYQRSESNGAARRRLGARAGVGCGHGPAQRVAERARDRRRALVRARGPLRPAQAGAGPFRAPVLDSPGEHATRLGPGAIPEPDLLERRG